MPYNLEGGTPNVLGVVGLIAGLEYVRERGIEAIRRHELDLLEHLDARIRETPPYRVHGQFRRESHVGALSISHPDLPATEIGAVLDSSFDIAVRPGLHCAPYIHRALGTFPDGTLRISPGAFSTRADLDCLVDALVELAG